jgi:hypothetical protein
MDLEKPFAAEQQSTVFGWRVISWEEPRVMIRALFQATVPGSVWAFTGAPWFSAMVGFQSLAAGFTWVSFTGPAIQCLVVSDNVQLQSIAGTTAGPADHPSWELVEHVGLPVQRPEWAGVFDLDRLQGFEGSLVEPVDAALDRYRRGAPFYGWESMLEPAVPAPPWQLADPNAIIKAMESDFHGPLRQMITTLPPNKHDTFERNHTLAMAGGGPPAQTVFRSMSTLVFAAATDPLFSLISGFGTAFDDVDLPPITLGDRQLFGDPTRSDWDYMVTALYSRGVDGQSAPLELAAIVWSPAMAAQPLKPASLAAATDGHLAPNTIDQPWRGVVRVSWDKIPDTLPLRVGSYALARAQQSPAGGVEAIMGRRPFDTALQPISATTSLDEEQKAGRLQALDETYAIAGSPSPNGLRYGAAHQDLFGLWSPWSAIGHSIGEPPAQGVSILSARLDVTAPAGGAVCPATLVVELEWNWTARTLRHLELVGRLYAQTKPNEPPAVLSTPMGLQKSLASGPGTPFRITFNGGSSGTPDAAGTMQYISNDGKTILGVPTSVAGPRRYRITITGFQLDYASTGHLGLALWARGQENKAPQRTGPWSFQPTIVSASDPRPPLLLVEHENVLLASMADANGEHHARLTWPTVAGAVGYFIYTTTETTLRSTHGLTDPLPGQTLSDRLADLRDIFAGDTSRRSFSRINDRPIAATGGPSMSAQVTIPRGSKEIHLYLVLGVSAGQIESPWPAVGTPNVRKRPIAYAAPQMAVPSRPVLEVSRILDKSVTPNVYRSAIRIQTRAGATVSKVDLHRVRVMEASLTLDTMGPPIATIAGSAGGWVVTPSTGTEPGAAQAVGTIRGEDTPQGSWKRVYYRAVAWSHDIPARGLYGGRSLSSAAQEVVIPPSGPPDLSPIVSSWPGGPLADVLLTVTSAAPVEATPLGPHRLGVDVRAVQPDDSLIRAFFYPLPDANNRVDNTLEKVPTASPPPGSSGIWRQTGTVGVTTYSVLVKRNSVNEALKVRILLTDPLGRATERTLDVPAGSPLPPPVMEMVKIVKVPGKGFIFSFETSVPIEATPLGPYLLSVSFAPGPILPLPSGLPSRRLAAGVQVALDDIPVLRGPQDPFASPETIPLRRTPPVHGRSQIAAYLRGASGQLTAVLAAPDGRSTSIRRTLR